MRAGDAAVYVPALAVHAEVLRSAIPRLTRHLGGPPVVVTPDPSKLAGLGVEVLADDEVAVLSRSQVRGLLPEGLKAKAGWYYQQLLKYDIALAAGRPEVLVVDADTVLLRPVAARVAGRMQFPGASEDHASYYASLKALTGRPRALARSAVVNYMWFEKAMLAEMLAAIEARASVDWRRAILARASSGQDPLVFSEYETYANWCASTCEVEQPPIRLFRRGDLLLSDSRTVESVVRQAERKGYDAIAFEGPDHARSSLRRVAARLLFSASLCTSLRRTA